MTNGPQSGTPQMPDRRRRPPGWANPRSRPFRRGWVRLTRLHELYGVKIGQRHARRHGGALGGFPPILQIQTKSGCNASCVICPQRTIQALFQPAEIEARLYERIVEQCAGEPGLRGVGFVLQNEPLADAALFDRIRHFRRRVTAPVTTFVATNGTLLTPEAVSDLLSSGLDVLHVSCNGFEKADYEAVNRGKCWETFVANLGHLLAQDLSRLAVMVSFVRSALYPEAVDRAIAHWRRRGIPCFVHGINNRGGMVEDYERLARPIDADPPLVRLRKRIVRGALGCCPYPFLQMSVLAGGQVLVCTHDWGRRQVVGDLNTQTIREVWDGPVMRDIRLRHLRGDAESIPSCERCDVFTNAAFG